MEKSIKIKISGQIKIIWIQLKRDFMNWNLDRFEEIFQNVIERIKEFEKNEKQVKRQEG